jgi:hypothetical protein
MRIPLRQYADVLGDYLRPERPKVALLALLLLGSIGLQLLTRRSCAGSSTPPSHAPHRRFWRDTPSPSSASRS